MVPYPQGEGRGVKCRGVWVQPSSLREHCSHQLHSPPTGRHSGGRAPPGPCPAGLAAHSQGALAPAVQAQRPPVTQGLDPGNLGEHRGAPGLLCWWETHRKGPKSIRAVGAGLCDPPPGPGGGDAAWGAPGGGAAPVAGGTGLPLVPVTAGQEWCRGQAPSLGLKAASRCGEEVETWEPACEPPPTPGTPASHLTKEVGVSPWGVPPSAGSARELCFTCAETGA